MRALAFDAGFTIGYGALGGGKSPSAGSRQVRGSARLLGIAGRHCDQIVREVILKERPGVVGFAVPFVGQTFDPKTKRWRPIQPDSIRPLMSFCTIIEMVCDELRIRCRELDESECRRAFMTAVPRKSKEIKKAVNRAVLLRHWPSIDEHSDDALCVAARLLEIECPDESHEMTPLFSKPGEQK